MFTKKKKEKRNFFFLKCVAVCLFVRKCSGGRFFFCRQISLLILMGFAITEKFYLWGKFIHLKKWCPTIFATFASLKRAETLLTE
jgi:hypothetical protein